METLQLRNALIRIRKEEFGFTMFDGNKSIQANESFVLILKMIAYGDSAKKNRRSIKNRISNTTKQKFIARY